MTRASRQSRLATTVVSRAGHVLPSTNAGRLLILIYHRVRSLPDPMFPTEVHAESFDWQMALLRQYCNPVALAEAVPQLAAGRLPPRAVAVTFDDGYADNAEVALPILQRHGIPGTFFIATSFLNGGRMWNDSVIEALRAAPPRSLDLTDYGLGVVSLGPEPMRGLLAESLLRMFKHRPPVERLECVDALCRRIGTPLPDDLMMTSGQVRKLAEAGMEIGAHTQSHPILRNLCAAEARTEIEGSRRILEETIGRPVRAFAYPNGQPGNDYTFRDREIVEALGFEYAPSTTRGVADRRSDRFQLPRFTPWAQTPERWLGRLLLAYRKTG